MYISVLRYYADLSHKAWDDIRFAKLNRILPQSFMTEIFVEKNHAYHLRNKSILQEPKARTTQFGIESIAFLGCKLWHDL